MPDHEELLQQALDAIDGGAPVDEVIGQLPAEAQELASLIRLATAVRSLDHPRPRLQTAEVLQARVLAGQRQYASPAYGPALDGISGFFQKLRRPRAFVPAFALLLVMGIVILSVLALIGFTGPRRAHTALLVDVSGLVEVASDSEPDQWAPVKSGDRLSRGQRLRTGPGSEVTLVYYEGSRTTVGPQSDITLARLDYSWGKAFDVHLVQDAGRTLSSVLPLENDKSEFSVRTPSGTVQVHGTVFDVLVGDAGRTRFAVEDGQVEVIAGEAAISLNAGQAVALAPGEKVPAPDHLFSLQGLLTVEEGSTWFVSGVPFTVLPETIVAPAVGNGLHVQVDGRVLANGDWIADYITPMREDETLSEFTGVVQSMDETQWQIGDWSVAVDAGTEVGEGVAVGVMVKVVFGVAEDGLWRAASIQPLGEPESPTVASTVDSPTVSTRIPTSTSTATPPPTSIPNLTDTPTPTLTPTIVPTQGITPEEGGRTAPQDPCTGAQTHPTGDELARRFKVPYAEIMGWFCKGFGFGEIEQAYELSAETGTPVGQIFDMRKSGMGWGEIERQLEGKSKPTPKPADEKGGKDDDKGKGDNGKDPPRPTQKPKKTKEPKN